MENIKSDTKSLCKTQLLGKFRKEKCSKVPLMCCEKFIYLCESFFLFRFDL
jgi:hypothetical protein